VKIVRITPAIALLLFSALAMAQDADKQKLIESCPPKKQGPPAEREGNGRTGPICM
jgi:hypothetical protein